jgi:outer membrane protein assembly factor BamB
VTPRAARPASDAPGPVRWRWRAPVPASVGMPAADATAVAATYGHMRLVLFGVDGTKRWEAERLGLREEAPLLTADLVVVPADDGLVAVDRARGRIRWDARFGETSATPVRVGSLAITCTVEGSVVAVDLASGAVAWRMSVPGAAEGPPATDGHTVVVSWEPERGTDAGLTAVDGITGSLRWSGRLRAGGVSGPAVVAPAEGDAFVVVVDDDLSAKAFDLATGRSRWALGVGSAGSPEVPPLVLPGGRVLVADRLAGLTLVDAAGKKMWSTRADAAAVQGGPVGSAGRRFALPLANGRILLAGPGTASATVQPPGGVVNGLASALGGPLFVATARGDDNQLVAYG